MRSRPLLYVVLALGWFVGDRMIAQSSLALTKRETELRVALMTLDTRESQFQAQSAAFQEELRVWYSFCLLYAESRCMLIITSMCTVWCLFGSATERAFRR